MATIKYYVCKDRKADGTYPIRLTLIHNRRTKSNMLPVSAKRDELTRDGKRIKDTRLLDSIEAHVARLRRAMLEVDAIDYMDVATLWRQIEARMAGNEWRLDFFDYARQRIERMQPNTASRYTTSLNAFVRFLERDTLDINEVTYPLLVRFKDFVERENSTGSRAVSAYLTDLRAIHNAAREEYNDEDVGLIRIPRQPFRKGLIPRMPAAHHRALTVEQVKAIRDAKLDGKAAWARDCFMLSFYLCGINAADMRKAKTSQIRGGVLEYNRSKTTTRRTDKAYMRVRVEPEAAALIGRLSGGGWLVAAAAQYTNPNTFAIILDKHLKEVAEAVGLDNLTTYYARHTWATLARNEAGIAYTDIAEALNHARHSVTDTYIERDWSRVWEANRKVLDLLV